MDKQFVNSVKQKYRERLINRDKQWPPCKSSKLVRLELVEGVKGEGVFVKCQRGQENTDVKRTPIEYVDLFEVESGKKSVRKILVEGDAGIGKTTLSIAVCEDWANERLFQQFELLILLPLRHQEVVSVGSLPELLKLLHSSEALCTAASDYLTHSEGKEVLIIADGWDEIAKDAQLKESFLYMVLFKGYLPFASVILTSRHSASTEFHRQSYFDRFVEISGFDKESIAKYIESEFISEPSKADHLRQQLAANPLVESVCSIPLNCAIICHLWRQNSKEALPTTMTELYSKIIRNVILRNLGKDANHTTEILRLPTFNDIPTDLKQPWVLLCSFAFRTMKNDQIVFSVNVLDSGIDSHKKIFSFGLLQPSPFLLDDGYGKSYHFLHRTFQEFLAAFHLAKTVCESGYSVRYNTDCRVLTANTNIFWQFFFGICFNKSFIKCGNYQVIKPYLANLCAMYKEVSINFHRRIRIHLQLMLCHSAFEANNNSVYSDVINTLVENSRDNEGQVIFSGFSAHDCTSMIEIINHMQDGKIIIRFNSCGLMQNQVDLLCKVLQKHIRIKVEELWLQDNNLESVENLFSGAQNNFRSLLYLNLDNTMINTVKFLEQCYMLKGVTLSNNPLGISGMKMLQNAVAGGSLTNLEYLFLENALARNASGNVDYVAFSELLEALSAHCPHLRELDLSRNNLGQAGAIELAKIKSQFDLDRPWLSTLKLNRTKLGDEGLHALIKTLNVSWYFYELQLCGNDIHAIGVRYLVEGIQSGKIIFLATCLSMFDLGDNPLGYEGLIEIGKMLSDKNYDFFTGISLNNFQLTNLLTCNEDTSRKIQIVQQLYQMRPNLTVSRLFLDNNRFTGDSINILVGFMCFCQYLELLATRNCAMSSSDFNQLCDKLVQLKSSGGTSICGKLSRWFLDGNRIGDEGTSTLMKHKPSSLFPKVRKATKDIDARTANALMFCGNPISDEMIEALSKELNNGQEVKKL